MLWFGHKKKLNEIKNCLLKLQKDSRELDKKVFELDEKLTNLSNKFKNVHCYDFLIIRGKRIKVSNGSIKTWANRYDVDVGDKGYGAFWYREYKTSEPKLITIKKIDSDESNCFISEDNASYPFFIPLKIVENA